MATTAISATGLRKSFGDHVVLDGVDLNAQPGAVFSLLGANGAGKTTTVHILSTLLRPASTYSGGMRRRLDLAMTLVGSPRVIFLDEPTNGLDPRSRRSMWQTIRDLVADGVTAFLTTQYLEEADELADRIAVLDHGRVVAEGTADELKRSIPGGHIRLRFADSRGLDAAERVLGQVSRDADALALRVPDDGSPRSLKAVLDRIDDLAIDVEELSVHTPDLDDVFLALTGNAANGKVTTR